MDFELAIGACIRIRYIDIFVNVPFTLFIVLKLSLRLILRGIWVKEEVRIRVTVVIDLRLHLFAIQIGEVGIGAGGEALDSAVTKLSYLLVERIVSHDCDGSHGADWPKEESEEALHKVQTHVLRHMLFLESSIKDGKRVRII